MIVKNKTEIQKKKISNSLKEIWANRSPEEKKDYLNKSILKSLGNRTGSTASLEARKKMSFAKKGKPSKNAKQWDILLIDPNGIQYGPIINLTNFSKKHNLVRRYLRNLLNKKVKCYKGWTLML